MWKMMVEYVARDGATSQSALETGVVGGGGSHPEPAES